MERRHSQSRFAPLHSVTLHLVTFHLITRLLCCIAFFAAGGIPTAVADEPLHNLLISVKNNNSGDSLEQQQGVSGGIKRDKIFIGTGGPVKAPKEGVTIRHEGLAYNTANTQRTFSSISEQKIRAVEGYPAFLYTGQAIHVPTQDSEGNTYLEEVDALRGFYITARLAGERVILTISLSNDRFSEEEINQEEQERRNHQDDILLVDTQRLSTTVSGRLGEWIDLGGVTLGDTESTDRQVKKTTARSGSIGNIAVKINALD